jgi:hypothetical protein
MSKSRYLADVIQSIAAFGIGIVCASVLHGKWYYGGWMGWFGDPPAMNPAYTRFAGLFEMLPYVAGGVAAGFVAGFGYFEPMRVAIRFGSVVVLFLVSLLYNQQLTFCGFLPAAIGSFVVSTGLSVMYFRLLIYHQQELKAWAERWERVRIAPSGKM